jgi:hypothetical protein
MAPPKLSREGADLRGSSAEVNTLKGAVSTFFLTLLRAPVLA